MPQMQSNWPYANEEICPQYRPKESAKTGTQLFMSGVDVDAFDNDDAVYFAFLQRGVVCKTNGEAQVPHTWILLDNQATIDVFCNKNFLHNIRTSKKQMDMHCNAGVTNTNLIGNLATRVWHCLVPPSRHCQYLVPC
jgi:hypothetical protein